jgi:hypothetical protein
MKGAFIMSYQEIYVKPMHRSGDRGVFDSWAAASSVACPERIAKVLVKRGWCQTEHGWGHEKIAPVYVPWEDAVDIQLSTLSPVLLARHDLY